MLKKPAIFRNAPIQKNQSLLGLTPVRAEVLAIIQASKKPLGAYAVLAAYKKNHPKAAPPTIYRALEFLLARHKIHRIEKLNAFVACDHDHGGDAQFLICEDCGDTREVSAKPIVAAAAKLAKQHRFLMRHSTVEMTGLCTDCQDKA